MRFFLRFAGLLVSGLLVSTSFAHGDSPSLEAEEGRYLIDIGHEELAANDDIEFDFDLFDAETLDFADFASVDVRVTRDGAELTSGSIENDAVHIPVMTVNFPEPGGYDIDVRYLDASDALLAAHTFHVEVPGTSAVMLRDGETALHYAVAIGLFTLSLGIGGHALWQRFAKNR